MKRRPLKSCFRSLGIETLEARCMMAGDDTLATATHVNFTYAVQAQRSDAIDPLGDVDMYSVDLTAGDTLQAQIEAQTIGSSLDSYLRIFDSAGNELASNDDANGTVDSALTFQAASTATYYVGVSDTGNFFYDPTVAGSGGGAGTGPYNLDLLVNPGAPPGDGNDTLATAELLNFVPGTDVTKSEDIADPSDVDLYLLNLSAGDSVAAHADANGSPLDGMLRVFDAAGNELTSNDDTNGVDPAVTFTASTAGAITSASRPRGTSSTIRPWPAAVAAFPREPMICTCWSPLELLPAMATTRWPRRRMSALCRTARQQRSAERLAIRWMSICTR